MALAAGTKLGSYEVVSQIGAGGMGEVYQAHDTKLGRDVAIKVLPEAFAHDADRLSRFQREAKMLAALNHANIATIYGLEQSGGTSYLVMELVSGETLAERVKAGPLPVEEALKIAVQIAEALEAAHEKNIIHRDLKPANVKVTSEGKVKVLDFGLAKAFAGDVANDDPSNSPTLSRAATMQGVILGTAAYMSPEQARGKVVDKRTDIWAFGCVLYELLTGKRAFEGETTTEILAAVLRGEPDWQALPASTPVKIRDLLGRCLQKDKTLRLRDAGDSRIEIHEALTAPPSMSESIAAPAKGISALRRRTMIFTLLGTLLLGGLVSGLAVWNLKPSSPKPVTRTVINLPPGQQLAGLDNGAAVVLSPDGTHLAYVARQGGTQQLYLRAMDTLEAQPMPGTEGAVSPFFSPDGQWLGFFQAATLKKVSLRGGTPVTLSFVSDPRGASWDSQRTIILAPSNIQGLQQISEEGGVSRPLTQLEKGDLTHKWPEVLPGGKAVVFVAASSDASVANARIVARSIQTGKQRDFGQGGTYPRYMPSGHLIYAQGTTLMAMPFDPDRLEIEGSAIPVVEGVAVSRTGATQYSISTTGSLVYVSGGTTALQLKLVWVNRNGTEQVLAAPAQAYRYARLSPDGRRIAVEADSQIWIYDIARDTLTRLTFDGAANLIPVWTPDGKRIAFESNKEGSTNLYWQPADGSGGAERISTSQYAQVPRSWSPDGQLLAFHENNPTTKKDIWILRLSDHKAEPFLRTPFNEGGPVFSPDGHWIAYISDESGRNEIYVQPYPGPGGKWQISTEGGTEPAWNRNGRELFYRSGSKIISVEVTTQLTFSAGKPKVLFEGQYSVVQTGLMSTAYDVSPDGQRFLMLKPVEQAQAAPTQINVVLNWFEELKQKVPTGKN